MQHYKRQLLLHEMPLEACFVPEDLSNSTHLPKHDMFSVTWVRFSECDEKLRAICVGSWICLNRHRMHCILTKLLATPAIGKDNSTQELTTSSLVTHHWKVTRPGVLQKPFVCKVPSVNWFPSFTIVSCKISSLHQKTRYDAMEGTACPRYPTIVRLKTFQNRPNWTESTCLSNSWIQCLKIVPYPGLSCNFSSAKSECNQRYVPL